MPHQLHGIRILTPAEFEKLIDQITKQSLLLLVRVMLFTGMRFEEIIRLKQHPEDFNETSRSVWVQSGKKKAKSPERYVPLTEAGTQAVKGFLEDERATYPSSQGMTQNFTKWANNAYFDPIPERQMTELHGANIGKERRNIYGVSVKMMRRTWENWLLTVYPERVFDIMNAQGHDVSTSSDHYAGAVFSPEDVEQIREYVKGWKPA